VTALVSPELRAAVGRALMRRVSFPVSEADIRRWAIAVSWPEPPAREFFDVEYAEATQPLGYVAPQEFDPFAWLPASTELLGELPVPPLRFRLNGGVRMEYGAPIRPGDVLTSVKSVGEVDERTGRHGPMLFTVTVDRWTNQRDDLVKLHHFTVVHYGGD
jgi:MaoC dehydratase-like protein